MKKIMIILLATAHTTYCTPQENRWAHKEKATQIRRDRAQLKDSLTAGALSLSGLALAAACAKGIKGSSNIVKTSGYIAGFALTTMWAIAGLTGLAMKASKLKHQMTAYLNNNDEQNQ